eukprot:TRINITY_DN82319_c0_g1_i1.p1 TRINITY_DN82319_c0_g1~~TRINITY_DN82319_c0_g1_i1.p1  ORF type:complete len:234 (-),score=27.94 TRINITY_DN82319_c0_g1_i1:83-736(-)
MNKSGEPVINDPRDALLVHPCEVKYFQNKGVPAHRETWRPLWKNHNVPYQYDKKYLAAIEHARMHATERQQKEAWRRGQGRTDPMAATVSGFSHTGHVFTDDPEGRERYNPMMSRTLSEPGMRSFPRKAHGHANSTFCLTGGVGAGKNILGSSQGFGISCAGMHDLKGAHIPGYRGFVPGMHTENLALSTGFSKATNTLGRLRSGIEGMPLPAPFIP